LIVYDGIYRLKRYKNTFIKGSKYPVCKWRLRIIDFSLSRPDVKYLRPFAVVAIQTGCGLFKTSCAESMGKRICRDFNLDINKILWAEMFCDKPEKLYVACFKPKYCFRAEIFYSTNWRLIRQNEFQAINHFIPELPISAAIGKESVG